MSDAAAAADANEALAARFRGFYADLFAIKESLRRGDWAALLDASADDQADDSPTPERLADAARSRLRAAILAATRGGGADMPAGLGGLDPGAVMAAVADHVLLTDVDWPGRDAWARAPLERTMYGGRDAADRVAAVAGDAPGGAVASHPEAAVGLTLLALDLRPPPPPSVPAPRDLGPLVAGAAKPLIGPPSPPPPPLWPWLVGLAGIVVVYLLVSWVLWRAEIGGAITVARGIALTPGGSP
jgi:hypothetical protein